MNNTRTKYCGLLICLALAFVTAAVFNQVRTHDFVNYDDPVYVTENPNIQAGITLEAVKWAFTTRHASMWHPLTWISHMLEWQLFGSNPAGHHVTNLVFHITNTLLLFLVLKKMTGAIWQSAFVAALFALHPLHVESVAWAAERKDVLSTLFWLLTMWAYARYVSRPGIWGYLLVVVFFALGLMSKPMVVTLPFVLLLLDYWPLQRFSPAISSGDPRGGKKHATLNLFVEKIPLWAMAAVLCVGTFILQKKGGAIAPGEDLSFPVRLANVPISYLQYIIKMIWPVRLAVLYPHPRQNVSIPYAAVSAVVLLVVTILVFRFSKNRRYLVTGWLWYLGTLVPVIGFVQAGGQAMADRYTYITLTGLFIIIAWGVPDLLARWTSTSPVGLQYKKTVITSSAILIILAMSIFTHFQLRHWRNNLTLFQHALDVTQNNYVAHFLLAGSLHEQGRLDEVIYHCSEVIRIKPDHLKARINLGRALCDAGRYDEAVKHYEETLQLKPDWVEPMNSLAWLLAVSEKTTVHDPDRAIRLALRACELTNYNTPQLLDTLAAAYAAAGAFDKAVETAEKAFELCQSPEQNTLKQEIEERLALYRAGKSYTEER